MARKSRIILIIALLSLFLVAAPAIVGYSLGYRIDFNPPSGLIKITQTGGFYFKIWPKGALVLVDEKTAKRTDFFFGAAYLDNLLPKKYEVEIQKQNYHPWRKQLQIEAKQVTDAKNIILLPQNPEFSILSRNVEQFFFFPDQSKIILKEKEKDSWALKLLETQKNIKSHLVSSDAISTTGAAQLIDLKFSNDSEKIILQVNAGKEAEHFSLDISELPSALIKEEPPLIPENQRNYYIDDREAKLSPDKRKLLYFSSSEVWVLFLEEDAGQPKKRAGERLLIARFSESIKNAFWLGNHYLIFASGEKIKVAEIDDRQSLNIIDLTSFSAPEIFFSNNSKKLYVLSENNLYVSDTLAP